MLSIFCGRVPRNSHDTATIISEPSTKPSSGETMMKATVFQTPAPIRPDAPTLVIVAPTRPPISACELDDGMPRHQVMKFHAMAPINAPKTT